MRTRTEGLLVLLLGALLCASVAGVSANTRLLPVDQSGYQKLLQSQAGKVVLVDFWATWCEPCREEMPALVRLAEKYAPRGFRLVTISADDQSELSKAEQFLRSQRVPFPAYYMNARDSNAFINSVSRSWSGALPALFLYDSQGRLAASFVGESEMEAVEAAIRKALRPAAPAKP